MVGNLWRLGRTPSQAEFEMFFSNIANVGSQQNLAAATMAQAQAGFPTAATALGEATNAEGGIPRVASIDFLRKLIMNQQAMPMAPGGGGPPISGMMPVMQGGAVSGGMHGAGESLHFPAIRIVNPCVKRKTRWAFFPSMRTGRNTLGGASAGRGLRRERQHQERNMTLSRTRWRAGDHVVRSEIPVVSPSP
jgi:hypothetical protein